MGKRKCAGLDPRSHVVALRVEGYSARQIQKLHGYSTSFTQRWFKKHLEGKPLDDERRGGRPSKAHLLQAVKLVIRLLIAPLCQEGYRN